MLTAWSAAGLENVQIDAGVVFVGLDYKSAANATALLTMINTALVERTKLLGITRGGGSFNLNITSRTIEADGSRNDVVGATVFDKIDPHLTGTALEFKEETLLALMPTAVLDSSSTDTVRKIRFKNSLEISDYLPNVTWFGNLRDGRLAAINLENVVNITGLAVTITDKGEGTMPYDFKAHQGSIADSEYVPADITIFSDDEAAPANEPKSEPVLPI